MRLGQKIAMFPAVDAVYAILLLVGPVLNPWYCLWILPFALMRGSPWTMAIILAASLGYANYGNLGLFTGEDPDLTPFDHPAVIIIVQWGVIALGCWLSHRRHLAGRA